MSFRDFNDEGPGTVEWDVVLGENTTGLFPDEVRYEMVDGELKEVLYRHAGGGKYEPVRYILQKNLWLQHQRSSRVCSSILADGNHYDN